MIYNSKPDDFSFIKTIRIHISAPIKDRITYTHIVGLLEILHCLPCTFYVLRILYGDSWKLNFKKN